jgi:hypothetical protein
MPRQIVQEVPIPPFQAIQKRAEEAKSRQSAKKHVTLSSAVKVKLPQWNEAMRCLPNEIAHSALFNAKNRRQARAYLERSKIAVIGDGRITFTGRELRQDI